MEYTHISPQEQVFIVNDRIRALEAQHFSVSLNIMEVQSASETYRETDFQNTMKELDTQKTRLEVQIDTLRNFLASAPVPEDDEEDPEGKGDTD